jgi:hypothetical protein
MCRKKYSSASKVLGQKTLKLLYTIRINEIQFSIDFKIGNKIVN